MMTKSEKINLGFTIAGPIIMAGMIAWVGWSVKATLNLRQMEADRKVEEKLAAEHQFVTDKYVDKATYSQNQSDTNSKLVETNAKLDMMNNTLLQVRLEVAQMGGASREKK